MMSQNLRLRFVVTVLTAAGLARAATFDEAQALYRTKRYAEARVVFEQVAAAEPGNAEAAYHLGELALMRNDEAEAIKWFEKAVALMPRSASYVQALGDAYGLAAQKAGLFSKPGLARKCRLAYEKAVALEPDNISARYALFTFYRQAPAIAGGGLDKARAQAVEIRKRDPVRGTIALAEISVIEKKYDDAFDALAALRRSHPECWDAAYQVGRTAAMSGQRLDDGAAALKAYLAHTPDEDQAPLWAAHWRLGQILEKKGDAPAARTEYEAALKLNPTQPQLLEAMQRVK
ncbi:MAG TPA: tetratricopeptide repeat protein [Opitutaceae bacterium]|nr:tetratricopeptide repeat protein [Opitutaceae bacterium]